MLGVSNAASDNALAAGIVMGVMIIPLVSSMSDDSIAAVPNAMRDGSLAMGATKSETIKQVLLPAALPGVVGGVLLAVSRAIGETMIVVMAAGYTANLTANPFDTISTVTVQIVALLTGDQDFASPHTLAAFALGLALFVTTFFLNYVALRVVKKYREAYESRGYRPYADRLERGCDAKAHRKALCCGAAFQSDGLLLRCLVHIIPRFFIVHDAWSGSARFSADRGCGGV